MHVAFAQLGELSNGAKHCLPEDERGLSEGQVEDPQVGEHEQTADQLCQNMGAGEAGRGMHQRLARPPAEPVLQVPDLHHVHILVGVHHKVQHTVIVVLVTFTLQACSTHSWQLWTQTVCNCLVAAELSWQRGDIPPAVRRP